jgi:hypothetical protein
MKKIILVMGIIALMLNSILAQNPTRVGTTTANFLEIGYGTAGSGMGDAYVSMVNDLSSIYWNPAGLANLKQYEAMFILQPWIEETKSIMAGVGFVLPKIGTLAISVISMDYGEMEVTTMEDQEGTGEIFFSSDMAFIFSFGRKLATWFSTGASVKYITSKIWHTSANAVAFDFGVLINTSFFSPTGNTGQGLKIGMSISNYGTRMQYDGMDLMNPIDILPDEGGNYGYVEGQFRMQEWELPLIFRIGTAINLFYNDYHQLTIAGDALHPNNNGESVNVGVQYVFNMPSMGKVYFRGGYKALFMNNSEYGPSFGFGITTHLLHNTGISFEYAYRDIGILGNSNSYSIRINF